MGGRIRIRDINQSPGDIKQASGGNDPIPNFSGGSQGSIAYRGAVKWEILGPDTAGKALQTNGPGADPSWETIVTNLSGRATGKVSAITSSFDTAVT